MATRRLLDRHEVEHIVSMPRSTIYEAIGKGTFPAPIRVGVRGVRWFEDEISAWMESRERAGPPPDRPRTPPS